MSMDERSLDVPIPDRAHIHRATPELRWLDGRLQQAWAPLYGGEIEWRDVPTVTASGVTVDVATHPLLSSPTLYERTGDVKGANTLLVNRGELRRALGMEGGVEAVLFIRECDRTEDPTKPISNSLPLFGKKYSG